MSAEAVEPVEREVTLSFRTFSVAKQALLYANDTVDDEVDKYEDALADLVGSWNEATERERGGLDA